MSYPLSVTEDFYAQLESSIAYSFVNRSLLIQAFTHRSWGKNHNERLEYLGDSILNSAVSYWLFSHKGSTEGVLSQLRSRLVCESALEEYAKVKNLERFLQAQPTIKTTASLIADSFEALCAALFLDSSWEAFYSWLIFHYEEKFIEILSLQDPKDYKTLLQEFTQKNYHALPVYTLKSQSGEDHQPHFVVTCRIFETETQGQGFSKKQAQQEAAHALLEKLQLKK